MAEKIKKSKKPQIGDAIDFIIGTGEKEEKKEEEREIKPQTIQKKEKKETAKQKKKEVKKTEEKNPSGLQVVGITVYLTKETEKILNELHAKSILEGKRKTKSEIIREALLMYYKRKKT